MDDNKSVKQAKQGKGDLLEEVDVKKKEELEDTIGNKLDDRDERITLLEDQLKRAVADYKNLERRSTEERLEAVKFANKNLIEALLPAFDTLFLAEKYTQDESVKLTIHRILEVLKENGIEKVQTNNAKYNAHTMEAIDIIEGEKDMVLEEVRPGFTIYGRLIRPTQVKVGGNK